MINNFSKSDDLLEVIFSNSQIMFAHMDTQFNFIRVNKAYAEANGQTPEFFVGKNHFDLFPDPENQKIFQNVILTGKPYLAKGKSFEHPKLGISYWDWHLQPLKDHSNRISAVILSIIDVTNRIELHSNIMSQMADAIVAVDIESHVSYWNPSAERLYGIKSAEAIGKPLRDLYKYEWVIPEGEKESEKALRESGFWRGENIHIKRNGEIMNVESTVNVIKDNENRNMGVLAIIRDITVQKKLRSDIENLAKFPFENPNIVMRMDRDKLIFINPSGRSLLKDFNLEIEKTLPKYFKDLVSEVLDSKLSKTIEYPVKDQIYSLICVPISEFGYANLYGTNISELKQSERRTAEQNSLLKGISQIFHEALTCETEKELGSVCLNIAENLTESKFGLIGEINPVNGKLDIIDTSDPGWELGMMPDKSGYGKKVPVGFPIPEIYRRILLDGKGFFTNDPSSLPDSMGPPEGHPTLESFLGVPLIQAGNPIGIIALGNRNGGYRQKQIEIVETIAPAIVEVFLRKRSEQDLKRYFQQLSETEKIAHLGSWELDLESNHLSWSDETHRIFGISPQEFKNSYKSFLELIHPDDRKAVDDAYTESLRGEKDGYEVEHRIVRRGNGVIRTVKEECKHLRNESGKIVKSLGMVQDITEKKKIEQIKDQFITSVTHELRTPLVSIKGYIDFLLMDKAELPENVSSSLLVVQEQSNRLLRITDDLLDYRRLVSGSFELEWKSLNLIDVISKSILETQALMREKKQNLQVEVGDSPMWINGDHSRLVQVVSNLLINASKFTSREGTITVRRSEGSGVFKVSISDTGIGLRAEDLQRVFEPFATIDKPTYIKGTGIGLSVAKGIIEAHGGRLWVESEGLGLGSTFYFTIPKKKN
jgi:PAS domain S-box-containing protein